MKAPSRERDAHAGRDGENEPAPAPQPGDAAVGALSIDPLELTIGFGLVPLVDQKAGGSLLARVGVVRRQIASELGMVIAPVRIHDDVTLDSHEYAIKVRGVEVARDARSSPATAWRWTRATPPRASPASRPSSRRSACPPCGSRRARRAEAEALGYTVVDAESVIVTHLTETIRRHADELLTRQETKKLLDALKEQNAAAVEEVVPDKLGVGEVQRVLQHLLREGVSIRDLGTILEAIGDRAAITRDPAILAEYARQALARTITAGYLDDTKTLRAISLDPTLEQEIAESVTQTHEGEYLAMDPVRAQAVVAARCRARSSRRPAWACAPCWSARAASAGTCAG